MQRPADAGPGLLPRHWKFWPAAVLLLICAAGLTFAGWRVATWPASVVKAAATVAAAPHAVLQTASIAEIVDHQSDTTTTFRLDANAAVIVIDFSSLHEQALTLNRVAALIEKRDMPRDRILPAPELEAAILRKGMDPDRFYEGHDYRAGDLARFFKLADQDSVALNDNELWLRGLLDDQGWLQSGAAGAIITIPAIEATVDAGKRRVILQHELSHAAFFTDMDYVAYTFRFWRDALTDTEREAFRNFLGRHGYDTENEDLMANETQAYLVFTRDPRFFTPAAVGLSDQRYAELRRTFITGMADGWLKGSAIAPEGAPP